MKAYKVTEPNEGYAEILFAETRGAAKVRSEYYDGCNYTELHAVRTPEFDEWAAKGKVPKAVLFAHGWWWTCSGSSCTRHVTEETGTIIGDDVYCDKCKPIEETSSTGGE